MAALQGLKVPPSKECGECTVAILINSADLFHLDLDGVRILLPTFISALEVVLPDKDLKLSSNVNKVELRKSSIQLLLSMLVLPLHFQNVIIKELINTGKLFCFIILCFFGSLVFKIFQVQTRGR